MEIQGVFINVCVMYWSRECKIKISNLKQRYGEHIDVLLDRSLIKESDGFAVINFLDQQFSGFDKNSENGKKGAESKWGIKGHELSNSQIRSQRLKIARDKGRHTEEQWSKMVLFFKNKCVKCDADVIGRPTKDHIIPIYRGGSDGIENIQPLCRGCNSGKTNNSTDYRLSCCKRNGWRMDGEWLTFRGEESKGEEKIRYKQTSVGKEKKIDIKIQEMQFVCGEVMKLFKFNEINHPVKLFEIRTFLNQRNEKGEFEFFKKELSFYIKYKEESNEKIHSFPSYLQSGWNQENWEQKYKSIQKKNELIVKV